jgi:micrococcal nuclease
VVAGVIGLLVVLAVLAGRSLEGDEASGPTNGGGGARPAGVPAGAVAAPVVGVSDGDTIKVRLDGRVEPVRLIGNNAPEIRHPEIAPECYGAEASAYARDLLLGQTVYLERERSETDRYGRLLRDVWVRGANGGAVFVNERLVRGGYADARRYPPDVRYADRLARAEDAARADGAGLWGACGGPNVPLSSGLVAGERRDGT